MRIRAEDVTSQVLRDTTPPRLLEVSLADCVIEGSLDLDGVEFVGPADFQGAVFEGHASFAGAVFDRDVGFNEATFARGVTFARAWFRDDALFQQITAGPQDASFNGARFDSLALFANAVFSGPASFTDAVFNLGGVFGQVSFGADVEFDGVTGASLEFARCRFQGALASFQRFTAQQWLLTRAQLTAAADADVTAQVITLTGATFSAGAAIRCHPTAGPHAVTIVLDGARFGAPSSVAGSGAPLPIVQSMRSADASNLTLSNLALANCRFGGAHKLDQLRLEGSATFATSPPGWRFASRRPWPQRWTPRRVLAEEVAWRVQQTARAGSSHRVRLRWPDRRPMRWPVWQYGRRPAERMRWPEWGPPPARGDAELDPRDVAALYRALRQGREDHKDEPGAADFYYGEMEMRRWAARRHGESPLDRFVLSGYWLISGYALRASRAAATLLVVVAVFAALFQAIGFADPEVAPRAIRVAHGRVIYADTTLPHRGPIDQAARAITYSAATATAVAGAAAYRLTPAGDALRVVLRVLGPVLLALTALSIRGRIKR